MAEKTLSALTPADLLPHRGRMLLVEEIIDITRRFALTAATVSREWPLADDSGVDPLVLVELAAQTAGVCNSWNDIIGKGDAGGNKGWLVGIKKAEISIARLPLHSRILTRSENTHKYDMLREIFSVQELDGSVIGQITLQLIKAEEND
jgi:predicted hotdog family 3-hydroxylacyl-ACP dehydratase